MFQYRRLTEADFLTHYLFFLPLSASKNPQIILNADTELEANFFMGPLPNPSGLYDVFAIPSYHWEVNYCQLVPQIPQSSQQQNQRYTGQLNDKPLDKEHRFGIWPLSRLGALIQYWESSNHWQCGRQYCLQIQSSMAYNMWAYAHIFCREFCDWH